MYMHVTGPEKTGLIYIKYSYSYYGAYLSFYTLYLNFNEQLRIFCTRDKICINILWKLFNFKNSKFAQISRVDKTCFLRPSHIYIIIIICMQHSCSHIYACIALCIMLIGVTSIGGLTKGLGLFILEN